ncbi:AraC family transcriptional regulator [Bosea caraganae]
MSGRLPGSAARSISWRRYALDGAWTACRISQASFAFFTIPASAPLGDRPIRDQGRPIPEGLVGEVRRTVAGARLHIDHRHEEVEFDLVVRGAGSYTVGNLTYELKAGTLIWLRPGQQHRLVRSPKLEMWVVSLRADQVDALGQAEIAAQPSRLLPGEELVDLDRLLSQVAQDSDEPTTYNAGLTYALRRALRACRGSPPAHLKLMHPAVTRALLLLRESGAAFSLSSLAEESGIAAPYLSRLLVEHTNRSFVDWRNRIRLERFMEDYQPGMNLLMASLDAGFGSYARFHHVFHQMVGCTPSEWAHRADRSFAPPADETTGVAGFGVPRTLNLSIRQRWTRLVPLASPLLATCFDKTFLDRVLAPGAAPHQHAPAADDAGMPVSLAASDVEHLLAMLQQRDADLTTEFAQLIQTHDFGGIYAGVLRAYELVPGELADAVTAFMLVLLTARAGAPDPGLEQVKAANRQVRDALWHSATPDPRQSRNIHTALLCHFVVIYQALQAARASGDARAMSLLHSATLGLEQELFGSGTAAVTLTDHGLVRRT